MCCTNTASQTDNHFINTPNNFTCKANFIQDTDTVQYLYIIIQEKLIIRNQSKLKIIFLLFNPTL